MTQTANTFQSLKPIYKETYSGDKKRKKKAFAKLRKKILKDWKPKKTGM